MEKLSPAPKSLLVPRRRIFFTPSDGQFVSLSEAVPDLIKQPHVRVPAGEITGFESGKRSGLMEIDGDLYKAKGCRPTSKTIGYEPWGTQSFPLAQYEADRVLEGREAFIKEGLEYPLEPIGFWVYNHILFKGEPTAATLYKAKGYTRLDELLWLMETSIPFGYLSVESKNVLTGLLEHLGFISGQMLQIFHRNNFSWDSSWKDGSPSNAHPGNIVIFPDSRGNTGVGIVDFDNSITYQQGDDGDEEESKSESQRHDVSNLKGWLRQPKVISRARLITYDPENIASRLATKILSRIPELTDYELPTVAEYLLEKLHTRYSASLRSQVIDALTWGYGEATLSDDKIPWDDIQPISRIIKATRTEFITKTREILSTHTSKDRLIRSPTLICR